MRDARLGRHGPPLPVAHAGVVDHGIETAEPVDLIGDRSRLRNLRQVTDNGSLRPRGVGHRLLGARPVAAVEYDLMALFDQQLPGHQAEPGG